MKLNRIEAVIFDSDGTMLDTREYIFQGYEHVLKMHGFPVPDRTYMATYMGHPVYECYRVFAPGADVEKLSETHREFQKEKRHLLSVYDGLIDLMIELGKKGIKIGVCSSRGRNLVDLLKHVDVHRFCEVVVTRDDVVNHKPHPEGVLKALATLSVKPEKSIMVGDTPSDIGAGKAAGVLFTVGVTHGFGTREALQEAGADHILDNLRDILPLVV